MQKYTIPLVTSALITRVFFFFAVLCLSGVQVSAQPISSAVGLPGIDPNWNTVCTKPRVLKNWRYADCLCASVVPRRVSSRCDVTNLSAFPRA